MSHKAYLVNRVWIVCNEETHEEAGGPFVSQQEADRFILEQWRETKPQTALSESVSWDESDPAERLLQILDKPPAEYMEFRAAA